MASLIHPERFQ
jgi:hypothetical protein